MPVVADLASRLRDQGLGFVTVNFGDAPDKIARCLERDKLAVPVAWNGVGPGDLVEVFHVPSFPCLFLVDAERKVLWSEVGFQRGSLEAALSAAGFDLAR